jgi:hypothetical protein
VTVAPKTSRALQVLVDTPPWEWPDDTANVLLATLRDDRATPADKQVAADLAGELTVANDELVEQLVATLTSDREDEAVRAAAAIATGPVLESCDLEGFEDDFSDPPVAQDTYRKLQGALHALYDNQTLPKLVRRRILEAAVRSPEDWHTEAVRTAYASGDSEWKLTAVFCMVFIRGFEPQILEAMESPDPEIRSQAITAAGTWEIEEAWPRVTALVHSDATPKSLLLAAIQAVATLRPKEAPGHLEHLASSEDEEIAAAVEEALSMAEVQSAVQDEEEADDGPAGSR